MGLALIPLLIALAYMVIIGAMKLGDLLQRLVGG